MTESYELIEHSYDVVIVGAGGAAMRAALGMAASGLRTACVTKVFQPAAIRWRHKVAWPLRSLGGLVACRKRSGAGEEDAMTKLVLSALVVIASIASMSGASGELSASERSPMVFYRTVMVDGLSIFYREAGRPDAPTLCSCMAFRHPRGCTSPC